MRRTVPAAVVALLLVVVGVPGGQAAPRGAADVDPTKPGRHQVSIVEYDAGPTVLGATSGGPDPAAQPIVADLRGALFLPAGRGPFPVLLFQHGRHATCAALGVEFLVPACTDTPATRRVPSHRGYDYLARNLASHGYLVISVDANDINDADLAERRAGALQRAQLISRSLDLLHGWNQNPGPGEVGDRLVGKVDLSRLGLMGHSRGGEGVTYWTIYDRERSDGRRYGAKAVFSLAPIDSARVAVSGVAWATLLPLCDGDVTSLSGAAVYDRSRYDTRDSAPQAQYVVHGANHNWFNTVWTGDDYFGSDSRCNVQSNSSLRLSDEQQQQLGLAVMGSFLRRHVGGEAGFDHWLTGQVPFSPACDSEAPLACADLLRTSWLGPAAARTDLLGSNGAQLDSELSRVRASGGAAVDGCAPSASGDCPRGEPSGTPAREHSPDSQLAVQWDEAGSLQVQLKRPVDTRRASALVLRAAVPPDLRNTEDEDPEPGSAGQQLRLILTDSSGRRAAVSTGRTAPALQPPSGSSVRPLLLNGLRLPLERFTGINRAAITSVTIELRGTGYIRLADLSFS